MPFFEFVCGCCWEWCERRKQGAVGIAPFGCEWHCMVYGVLCVVCCVSYSYLEPLSAIFDFLHGQQKRVFVDLDVVIVSQHHEYCAE